MAQPPRKEAPILIDYIQREDHYDYDDSNTSAAERRPLVPAGVWADVPQIGVPPAQTPYPGTLAGVVRGISGVVLTPLPGNAFRYQSLAGQFLDMVPANYNGGAYTPTLRDAAGRVIPYNPSVWVADGLLGVVEFKYKTPAELGYTAPLTLAYWRYVGAFAGTVAAGQNLGAGASVFGGLAGSTMSFRTVAAGPGLTLGEDLPAAGEIQFSADEVSPAGVAAVPAALDLYVSAAGDDAAGAGTSGSPYLTLGRAFRDIRVFGYNDTARVTVLAAGGPYVIPQGVLALVQGTRGRRTQPVEIRGSGRTPTNVGLIVQAAVQDPVSGLIDVTVAAPPGAPFALGQIVRFTSGALAAFTPVPVFPPVAVECFVAEVVGPTTVRLPFALGVPAPGDTFDTLALDALVVLTGTVVVRSQRLALIWRDLRMDYAPVGGISSLTVIGLIGGFVGVWLRSPGGIFAQLVNVASQFGAGRAATVLATIEYTALGVYLDNTAPGGFLGRQAIDPLASFGVANSVFRGNGSPGNLLFEGAIPGLNECYFAGAGSVSVSLGVTQASNVWLEASAPSPNQGALEAIAAGVVMANGVRVNASSQVGLRAADGGLLVANTATVAGSGAAGVRCERHGRATTNNLTVVGNTGPGVEVADASSLIDTGGALSADGASTATHGIVVERGSLLDANALNCSGNAASGLQAQEGARVTVAGAITSGANGADGVAVERGSALDVGSLNCGGNAASGLRAQEGARVGVAGAITSSANGASGVTLDRATLDAAGAITSSTNSANGVALDRATLNASTISVSGNATSGLQARAGACVNAAGAIASNTNGANGVSLDSSSLRAPSVDTSANASHGLLAVASTVVAGSFTSNLASGGNGVNLDRSVMRVAGGASVVRNSTVNVFVTDSELVVGGAVSADSSVFGVGLQFTRSRVTTGGTVTAINNTLGAAGLENSVWAAQGAFIAQGLGGNNAVTLDGSVLTVQGALIVTAIGGGIGLQVARASCATLNVATFQGFGNALAVSELSKLLISGPATSTGAASDALFVDNSWVRLTNFAVTGAGGDAARLQNNTTARLSATVLSGASGDGLSVGIGCRAELAALSGGGNGGVGVRASFNTHVSYAGGTCSVTGAGGDVVVGSNAPVAWALLDAGANANVCDYASAAPQMCTATPH